MPAQEGVDLDEAILHMNGNSLQFLEIGGEDTGTIVIDGRVQPRRR